MKNSDLINKVKNKLWLQFKDYFYFQRTQDALLVQNINFDCEINQDKVLICYQSSGYFNNVEENIVRTLHFEIFKIVQTFAEFGFCIDIINCNDINSLQIVSNKKYKVIFGFGEAFYQINKIQSDVLSVLYMTENHPVFSFNEEKKRNDYFFARHGKQALLNRSGLYYKPIHLEKKYSHVITLSETEPLKHQYNSPYSIYPTGIINSKFEFKVKNHLVTRKNYLWLGSKGAIHKGLDLLIEVFSQRNDICLHICGMSADERKLVSIPVRDNIIDCGQININSTIFLELIDKCSFIILPSCSEGFSTSVTTGMLHGMIPAVMRNTGFNRLGDKAVFFDDYKIDYIDKELTKLSARMHEDLAELSSNVYDFARQNFTIKAFYIEFKAIMSSILN